MVSLEERKIEVEERKIKVEEDKIAMERQKIEDEKRKTFWKMSVAYAIIVIFMGTHLIQAFFPISFGDDFLSYLSRLVFMAAGLMLGSKI